MQFTNYQIQTKINLTDKVLNISAAEISLEAIEYDEADVYIDAMQSTTQIYKYDSDVVMIVYEEIISAGDR